MTDTIQLKKRIVITVDSDIEYWLKASNQRVSTLINNLLRAHISLYSRPKSKDAHNPEVVGSNPPFAILFKISLEIFHSFSERKDLSPTS